MGIQSHTTDRTTDEVVMVVIVIVAAKYMAVVEPIGIPAVKSLRHLAVWTAICAALAGQFARKICEEGGDSRFLCPGAMFKADLSESRGQGQTQPMAKSIVIGPWSCSDCGGKDAGLRIALQTYSFQASTLFLVVDVAP